MYKKAVSIRLQHRSTNKIAISKKLMDREQRVDRGRGWGWAKWVTGIEEDTGYAEHWVLYLRDELLNSTPQTNIILYVI